MTRTAALALCLLWTCLGAAPAAAQWRIEIVRTVGPVKAVESVGGEPYVLIGGGWFRLIAGTHEISFAATAKPLARAVPQGALPDGRVAQGREIARAWLSSPTGRYGHAVLGDAIEADSLVIERRDGRSDTVEAGADAVFEDLEPRIAVLGGKEHVVTVKSYLARGAALAVIGEREGRFAVAAETPPIGTPNRWLNPAGVADFLGEGASEIALVRMPHALGRLELWRWSGGRLDKRLELPDTSNHAIGSRVLRMSAAADFDGDGRTDLAIPSFDRRDLRLIAFAPQPRDIARLALPARTVTEIALLRDSNGHPAVVVGLENGALAIARRNARRF